MTDVHSMLKDFSQKKKDASPFCTLKDGESVKVLKVRSLTSILKEAFGQEKEVIRMIFDTEVPEKGIVQKQFDQGSMRWAEELIRTGVEVGSSFTITRKGAGTSDTRYIISDVVNPKPGTPPVQTSMTPPPKKL